MIAAQLFRRAGLPIALLVLACAVAGFAADQPPARVIVGAGSFVRVVEGWRCTYAEPRYAPPLLRGLRKGDVLVSIGGDDLTRAGALGLAQSLRKVEIGMIERAEVLRDGQKVTLTSPLPGIRPEEPNPAPEGLVRVMTAADSSEVLNTNDPRLRQGDRLVSAGGKPWNSIRAAFGDSPAAFLQTEFHAGTVLVVEHAGRQVEYACPGGLTLQFIRAPKFVSADNEVQALAESLRATTLHGLNTKDVALGSLSGRWVLVHFMATWCGPCVREAAAIGELTARKDVDVVSVGYSDSDERLRAFGAKNPALRLYAPNLALTAQLAVNGVPYDILVDPAGESVLIVSGDLPQGELERLLLQYLAPASPAGPSVH